MRYICATSGGKDSAALALYLASERPELPIEYVFTDTGHELPEVVAFLNRLSEKLDRSIVRITDGFCGACGARGLSNLGEEIYECLACKKQGLRCKCPVYREVKVKAQACTESGLTMIVTDFDYWLKRWDFAPSLGNRWCTKTLKIRPMERYIGKDEAVVYIGLRADEDRMGNYGLASNVYYEYPFIEQGIDLAGVMQLLRDNGLGLPDFYQWRTVGGCTDCFYQNKRDWFGLKRTHPEIFAEAMQREIDLRFSYNRNIPLSQIRDQTELPFVIEPVDMDEYEHLEACLICAK